MQGFQFVAVLVIRRSECAQETNNRERAAQHQNGTEIMMMEVRQSKLFI